MKHQTFYLLNLTSFTERDFGKKQKYYVDLCCLFLIIHILSFPGVTFQDVLFSILSNCLLGKVFLTKQRVWIICTYTVLKHTFFLSPRKTFYSVVISQVFSRLDIILGEEEQMWFIVDNDSPHNAVCIFLGRVIH